MRSGRLRLRELAILCVVTGVAVAVHGYHPAVEDAEIYLPGVLKRLDPSLFPYNAQFFQSHAGLTLFPSLVAGSVRVTHVPVAFAILGWHMLSIFLLLLACLRIAQLCFRRHPLAPWGGVLLVASLLTIPRKPGGTCSAAG